MPANDDSPDFAITSEVDARSWVDLFDMSGGGTVSKPTGLTDWEDPLYALNGRCSPDTRSMAQDLDTLFGDPAGTWSVYLNANDKVVIENTVAAFTLGSGAGEDTFGFAGGEVSTGVPPYQVVAPNDWVRGNVENKHIRITRGVLRVLPDYPYRAQDVVTMMRSTLLNDLDGDNRVTSIQWETVFNYGTAQGAYRWGLNEDGKSWLACSNAVGTAPDAAGFLDANFQRWLGFRGDEALQTVANPITGGSLQYIESTDPCASIIRPSRPMRDYAWLKSEQTATVELTSNEIGSVNIKHRWGYRCEWWLDGPVDCIDLSSHYLTEFLPRVPIGRKMTIYQTWGDPRRMAYSADVRTDVTGNTGAYSLLYNPEKNGRRGRVRGRRYTSNPKDQANDWPGPLRRRLPKTTIVSLLESTGAGGVGGAGQAGGLSG